MQRSRLAHITLTSTTVALFAAVSMHSAAPADPSSMDDDLTAQGKALIEKAEQAHRALKTYQDRAVMRYDVATKGGDDFFGLAGARSEPEEMFLAVEMPNRIAFEGEHLHAFCDGEDLWFYVPDFGHYVKRPAPASFDDLVDDDDMMALHMLLQHPVVGLLMRENSLVQEMRPKMIQTEAIEQQERDGRNVIYLRAMYDYSETGFDEPLPVESWYDAESMMLVRVQLDVAEAYNAMMGRMGEMEGVQDEDGDNFFGGMAMPEYEKFVISIDLHDVRMNEAIAAERFVFTPDEDMEETDTLMPDFGGGGYSQQMVLIGSEAPDFTLPTLDDEELTLSDLRGKVVLLDFWAMWCGPCVQALPHIQKLHEQFADMDVVVVGMNRDPHGSEDRLVNFLEQRDITFRQALDFDGEAAELYHVRGIPCTILIDKNGIVQDVSTGFMRGKEKELAEYVERLLDGETIYDADEIREIQAMIEAGELDEMAGFQSPRDRRIAEQIREEIASYFGDVPDRFAALESPRRRIDGAWESRLFDVDGDGKPQLVLPDHQGGINILNHDGSEVTRVRFRGLGSNMHIAEFVPMRIGGQTHWIIAATRWQRQGQSGLLGLFKADGESLWTITPALPPETSFSFDSIGYGDVTGDGRPEVVAILEAYRTEGDRHASWSQGGHQAHLLVINLDGVVLTRRSLGQYSFGLTIVDDESGTPATVIVLVDGRVHRFRFDGLAMVE